MGVLLDFSLVHGMLFRHIQALRYLFWFEVVMGLRAILNKSEMVRVGEVTELEFRATIMGCNSCKVSALLMTYWGLP